MERRVVTTYKYISEDVVAKIDADGKSRLSCSLANPEYVAWVALGNTPQPADKPDPASAAQAEALAAAKLSAQNKLAALGLTPAEIAAL